MEALVQVAVAAPGGLEDGARDACLSSQLRRPRRPVLLFWKWRPGPRPWMWASSLDLPTSMPATAMGLGFVIPVFLSFCNSGLHPRFRSGRAGMVATGRPSLQTAHMTKGYTVRPVAGREGARRLVRLAVDLLVMGTGSARCALGDLPGARSARASGDSSRAAGRWVWGVIAAAPGSGPRTGWRTRGAPCARLPAASSTSSRPGARRRRPAWWRSCRWGSARGS